MKIIINIPDQAKVIFDIVIIYYNILNSIISNWNLVFISKFWLTLYYFLDIK